VEIAGRVWKFRKKFVPAKPGLMSGHIVLGGGIFSSIGPGCLPVDTKLYRRIRFASFIDDELNDE
jgi:hypothetical protein